MLDPVVFKLAQFAVLIVFIVFISDFRRKKGMVPLIGEKWTHLLKALYLIPLAMYMHVLFAINRIFLIDILAFAVTLIGTVLVVKAKRDLWIYHTCAGYRMTSASFITNGIYSYIRHPLYTGIYVLILGSLFTIIPRLHLSLHILMPTAALICVSYVMGFIAFLASRETKALLDTYGLPFQYYMETVHPFLPLRKYAIPDYP